MKNIAIAFLCIACLGNVRAAEVGVRIRFGLTDKETTRWDGTIAVEPGRVALVRGWRFQDGDQVQGTNGWKAATRRPAMPGRSNRPGPAKGQAGAGPMADNGVLVSLADVTEQSRVTVKTSQGNFEFALADIPYGKIVEKLNGAVELERTAATKQLTTERTDDDFPALAVGKDGATYVAYISFTPGLDRDERARRWEDAPKDLSFLAKTPGGDQLWLRVNNAAPIAVTPGKGDIYKCAVAVAGDGQAWIIWAENKSWPDKPDANFEIYARSFKDGKLSDPVNVSNNAGSDVCPVVATDSTGHIWLAWQAARDNVFRIVERHQTAAGNWSDERPVSTQTRDCWSPAIAAGGRVAIGWDTYEKGDFDVWVREFAAEAKADDARPVANSADYEARAALTYDAAGALWIAWEHSGPTWGKDFGALVKDEGIPLYRDRQIGLAILQDGKWKQPAANPLAALPDVLRRRRVNNQRVPPIEPGGESRKAGQEAELRRNVTYNNLARIMTDKGGRVWLFCRSRQNDFRSPIGSLWLNYAAYCDGQTWTGPILVPHSDNLLYNTLAVAALPGGDLAGDRWSAR